jgi:hypothetical protein
MMKKFLEIERDVFQLMFKLLAICELNILDLTTTSRWTPSIHDTSIFNNIHIRAWFETISSRMSIYWTIVVTV